MSRIKRIVIQEYRYTLEDLGPAIWTYQKGGRLDVTKFVVTVETDDGLTGSYAPHFGATSHAAAQVDEMARALIDHDAEQREKIFELLKNGFRHYDKVGIAALDCALWDLAGKKYGTSVARLLGGFRQRLPAYASTFPGQRTPGGLDSVEKYGEFAQECRERGFPGFKIHSFFDGDVQTEIDIMTAVRNGAGSDMRLMTDPEGPPQSPRDRQTLSQRVRERAGAHKRDRELLGASKTRLPRDLPPHVGEAPRPLRWRVRGPSQPPAARHHRPDGRDGVLDGGEAVEVPGFDPVAYISCMHKEGPRGFVRKLFVLVAHTGEASQLSEQMIDPRSGVRARTLP